MPRKTAEQKRATVEAYRAKNRDIIRISKAAWYAANREKIAKQHIEYREANKEKIRVYTVNNRKKAAKRSAKCRTRHPEKILSYTQSHKAEQKKRSRTWYEKNRERALALSHLYDMQHAQEKRMYRMMYYRLHREKLRIYSAAWHKAFPEKTRMRVIRRRARINNAPINNFTHSQWIEMKEHFHYCCIYCGKKTLRLTMDHITPLSKGGAHTKINIVPSCGPCNSKKHTGPPLKPVQPLLL